MAFTDDAVKAKLSALNETQESIVTVAQWVMFYKYKTMDLPSEREKANGGIKLKTTCRSYCAYLAAKDPGVPASEATESHLPSQRYEVSHSKS